MPIPFRHVGLFFTLMLLWLLMAKAHITSDKPKYYYSQPFYSKQDTEAGLSKSPNAQLGFQANKRFLNEEFQSSFEPFRTPHRRISQRAALQNLDLYTARGYGKRSECMGRICRKEMELSGARMYGKRNANITPLICLLTDCNDLDEVKAFMMNNLETTKAKFEENNTIQDE